MKSVKLYQKKRKKENNMRIIIGFIILGAMLYFSLSVCSVGKETDRVMEEYIRKMDEEEQRVEANITKEEKV